MTQPNFSSEKGLTLVEVMISFSILLTMVLAALSLWGFYSSSFTTIARRNDANTLGVQIVSEMQTYSGRYPRATSGGQPVIYRRCFDRALGLVPDGSDLVRIVTDVTLDLCPTPFQVDVTPDLITANLFLIEVKHWSAISKQWELGSVYRLAF